MINKNKFHFVGIKGSGMSALAQVLHGMGYEVKGSDLNKHFFTQVPLEQKGIEITEFNTQNVNEDETVVISRAFDETNPEVAQAFQYGNGQFYFDFLGKFINTFNTSIAISGSHGKTSTTGLMSHVLSGVNPTSFLIGDGTGKGTPKSENFVFEACEYKNHFLSYYPDYAVVTNIDYDHPDFFKSKEDVVDSFQQFAKNVKKALIVYGGQKETKELKTNAKVWTYGLTSDNDIYAENVSVSENGTTFDVMVSDEKLVTLSIPSVGEHHILNSLAVASVVILAGGELSSVVNRFATFGGVKRRFNETVVGDNVVIDDYAHHPTEIKATLQSIRLKYPNKKAVVLFQPHTYTRTKALFNEFVDSLEGFDTVFLADIFGSAREKTDSMGISSQDIVEALENPSSYTVGEKLPNQYYEFENSVLAFLGAGDVNKYKDEYLNKQRA
ncbi:UDP-N-acetylmuramate--L-alanine ligase [Bacillus cereus]|uniref:UDP-N-acetylmuramate--L-alanine ligase n=1 Tax=Bacillus cereus TaxID=1396 RepID=UPI00307AE129